MEENRKQGLEELLLHIGHLLHRYHRSAGFCGENGINPAQGQGRILMMLRKTGAMSQRELGFLLDIRPQSLAELLAKLERGGYILRRSSEKDRRVLEIELTEKGKSVNLDGTDLSAVFDCLTEEERTQTENCLARIETRLTELLGGREDPMEMERPMPGDWAHGPHGREGFPPPPPPFEGGNRFPSEPPFEGREGFPPAGGFRGGHPDGHGRRGGDFNRRMLSGGKEAEEYLKELRQNAKHVCDNENDPENV